MERVLIFGIGGFVGSYLANEFLMHGYCVLGADKNKGKMLPETVSFYEADLLDYAIIKGLVEFLHPDIIVNLAAISSVGASWSIPQMTVMVNVVGAINILEAVRTVDSKIKVLFVGSSEEYVINKLPMDENTSLDANNPYGISKITQELFSRMYRNQYGLRTYYVRPFNHTGVGQSDNFVLPSWCKQAAEIEKSGNPGVIKVGNLQVWRDFSHVKDIVRGYRMIIESGKCNHVYNIGAGVSYCLKDILQYIIGLSAQIIEIEVDQNRIRLADQPYICCNNNFIKNELGWLPNYSVYDALRELYQYYLTGDK